MIKERTSVMTEAEEVVSFLKMGPYRTGVTNVLILNSSDCE